MRISDKLLLGSATSATQIEGGCRSIDWYSFAEEPGHVLHGDSPIVACDHWNRWKEDIELQARLGMQLHRFSVEWGRIEPVEGRFDQDVLERYRQEVVALRAAGIEPMLTLHHFSLPTWLAAQGGVLAPRFVASFERFARRVALTMRDLVTLWNTINEPNVLVAQSYAIGIWPPGRPSLVAVPRAIAALRSAHARAYVALHETLARIEVGLAHHIRIAQPASDSIADRMGAAALDRSFNRAFVDVPQDFFGLNYYSRDIVTFDQRKPLEMFAARSVAKDAPVNDLGWEIYPEGLGILLRELGKRGQPIWITENGIADAADKQRGEFIVSHLKQVAAAMADGVDVRGYCHWSLLDNFEWSEGYEPRFGMYAVDYATQRRTLRPSGARYADIIARRELA